MLCSVLCELTCIFMHFSSRSSQADSHLQNLKSPAQHPQPKSHSIKRVQLHDHLSIWMKKAKNLQFVLCQPSRPEGGAVLTSMEAASHLDILPGFSAAARKPGNRRKVSFSSRLHCSREAAAPCKKTNKKCLQEIIHSSQALWQHILHLFCFFNSWSCAQIGCEVNKPTSLFFAGSLQQQEKKKRKSRDVDSKRRIFWYWRPLVLPPEGNWWKCHAEWIRQLKNRVAERASARISLFLSTFQELELLKWKKRATLLLLFLTSLRFLNADSF